MTVKRCDPFVGHASDLDIVQSDGPLSDLDLAVKDIFHVRGLATGAGNPDWLATHDVATQTAPAVQALLDAGAHLRGKTQTDELAYSLMGCNAHYGAPLNTTAPERVPGGSSSGSAAAVAAGRVDVALGSDTGGSVRVPASFCGLYGLRPTHGTIACDGMVPLAPGFDTVGWFARSADVLQRVGDVLVPPDTASLAEQPMLCLADDAFALAGEEIRAALLQVVEKITPLFVGVQHVTASEQPLSAWRECFRVLQAHQVWQVHGEWIAQAQPAFGPGVKERFAYASTVSDEARDEAEGKRQRLIEPLLNLLDNGCVLCLPTAPDPAPLRSADDASLDSFRNRLLELTAIAGLASLPQVTLPLAVVDHAPVGLSLIAGRGMDRSLLELASKVAAAP